MKALEEYAIQYDGKTWVPIEVAKLLKIYGEIIQKTTMLAHPYYRLSEKRFRDILIPSLYEGRKKDRRKIEKKVAALEHEAETLEKKLTTS
jgi:hypothetical protein